MCSGHEVIVLSCLRRSNHSSWLKRPCVWCVSCRCKQALVELRHLKSEAREATKLLEDKKVLEVKVRVQRAVFEPQLQPYACWLAAVLFPAHPCPAGDALV